MRAPMIVKGEIATDRAARLAEAVVGSQVDLLVFDASPQALDNTVSRQAPLPSMLIATPCFSSTPVKSTLVNWADSSGRRNTIFVG